MKSIRIWGALAASAIVVSATAYAADASAISDTSIVR